MAYTFAVDDTKIGELITDLKSTEETIETGIGDVYSEIEGMETNNSWSGSSYTTFYNGASQYREPLEKLDDVVAAFEKVLEGAKEQAPSTIEGIANHINSIQ